MSSKNPDPFSLIDDFLENRLSESDAEALLAILKKGNSALIKLYRDNAKINFLLLEKVAVLNAFSRPDRSEILEDLELEDLEKEFYKKEKDEGITPSDHFQDLDQWDDWTDLVAWEKSVQPIESPLLVQKDPDQTLPAWKKVLLRWLFSREKKICPDQSISGRLSALMNFCALFFLCVLITAGIFYNRQQHTVRPAFNSVGTVAETIDARWGPESRAFKRGETIGAENFLLQSGMVKVILANGVELILEGPGEYTINSPRDTFCKMGRLSVKVPPEGIGFEVATRFGSIIDQGTEFFVEVNAKNALVETIRGKVDVSLLKTSPIPLTIGRAINIDSTFKVQNVPKLSGRFIDSGIFREKLLDYSARKKEISNAVHQNERNFPNLIACFDFSDPLLKTVPNCSVIGQTQLKEATVYGGRSSEGDLYGQKALALDGIDDFIRFDLSGSYKDLSIVAHVRIDQLQKIGNVLLASERHHSEPGAFLWQIMKDGKMQIQITPPRNKMLETCFYSEPVLSVQNFRTWVTLALVADGNTNRISFYCDGNLSASVPWTNAIPLTPGSAMIGNIINKSQFRQNRSLSGAMKEMMIFNRALSNEEIKNISQNRL